jgi:hypothetical protein
MTQPRMHTLHALAGACALLASVAMGNVHAQSTSAAEPAMAPTSTDSNVPPATAAKQAREIAQGDPARWFRQDPGAAASLRRLQKEIGAALQEAQGACRKMAAAERKTCMSEARATYNKDMAGAQAQIMAERN